MTGQLVAIGGETVYQLTNEDKGYDVFLCKEDRDSLFYSDVEKDEVVWEVNEPTLSINAILTMISSPARRSDLSRRIARLNTEKR